MNFKSIVFQLLVNLNFPTKNRPQSQLLPRMRQNEVDCVKRVFILLFSTHLKCYRRQKSGKFYDGSWGPYCQCCRANPVTSQLVTEPAVIIALALYRGTVFSTPLPFSNFSLIRLNESKETYML